MRTLSIVVIVIAALACGHAATLNFIGARSVKAVADRLRMSHTWMLPLGALLASGSAGLLIGLTVPVLGIAAAGGLVAYFVCAIGAHVRARDRGVGGAIVFLVLALAALAAEIAHGNHAR